VLRFSVNYGTSPGRGSCRFKYRGATTYAATRYAEHLQQHTLPSGVVRVFSQRVLSDHRFRPNKRCMTKSFSPIGISTNALKWGIAAATLAGAIFGALKMYEQWQVERDARVSQRRRLTFAQ
jgi:hypothetical protein